MKLDSFDHHILRVLQRDASTSMEALAERVHLSRNAAWRRVKLMEEAGVITGRVAVTDAAKLGVPLMAVVLIHAGSHGPGWADKFATAVRALPQVVSAYRMTGDIDYLLRVRIADMAGYDRFYKELTSRVDISDVSASFVMEEIVETTAVPVGEL
ncbi:MAG: Lrp/AsnC family transcriptional regulator [Pseudomonadota bacterium]